MTPQPTGVVPFIAPLALLGNGVAVPTQDWGDFATTTEAQEMLASFSSMIEALPGASSNVAIAEKAADLGYVLSTPYDQNDPNSVGALVLAGTVTIAPHPVIQGAPTGPMMSGQISVLLGDLFARQWKFNQNEYDRNYTQGTPGAGNVNQPIGPGASKLHLVWLAETSTFSLYWDKV